MGLRNWFKRPSQPAAPLELTPEQRGPTTIRHAGITIQLPFKWERATGPENEPGAEEYRNTVLPEQLFITLRPLVRRAGPEELRTTLLGIAQHYRSAMESQFEGRLKADPPDFRAGADQMEVRFTARAPDNQIASLHRGDAGRIVSVSLFRYLDASKLDLREYSANIFDLIQFDPTPA